DGNAVDDATVNFTKPDLRDLFALVSGRQMVPVTITGALSGGTTFTASMTIEVIGTGGALAASVSPNPLNPEAVLTFHVAKAGRVTVGLYDARGRLVRRVVSGEEMSRGWHDLRLDGRSDDGRTLTSGVYFYRVDTQENSTSGRLTILK
ncbi:MAG TPA: T9SS type A sorting domain-containing protein, partial [Gemmatimonadaceae bacterium]|nr:T9SS type A sorting domain-containing protein [Gemmatimonadaceae bacterium]